MLGNLLSNADKSSCRRAESWLDVICLKSRQSSANNLASECFVDSGMPLTKARKSKGPNTVPCGTPESTSASVDSVPSSKPDCFLWLKKDSVQRRVNSRTPQ